MFSQLISPLIERIALRGVDLPVAATSPAFAYRFSFEGGAPERLDASLGPVFAERVETQGRRQGEIGFAYLHANLDRWEGGSFARNIRIGGTLPFEQQLAASQRFVAERLRPPRRHVLFLGDVRPDRSAGTSTCCSRWCGRRSVCMGPRPRRSRGPARPGRASEATGFAAASVGAGDTLLRTKYRFGGRWSWVAALLGLRLPAGDPDDFHGSGDVRVTPTLVASKTVGLHDVHLNLGWV